MVWTDMPDAIRNSVLPLVETLFPGVVEEIDSKQAGVDHLFKAFHIAAYNKYATCVSFEAVGSLIFTKYYALLK